MNQGSLPSGGIKKSLSKLRSAFYDRLNKEWKESASAEKTETFPVVYI